MALVLQREDHQLFGNYIGILLCFCLFVLGLGCKYLHIFSLQVVPPHPVGMDLLIWGF